MHWVRGRNGIRRQEKDSRSKHASKSSLDFRFVSLWLCAGIVGKHTHTHNNIQRPDILALFTSPLLPHVLGKYIHMHTKCQVCTWSWTMFFNFRIKVYFFIVPWLVASFSLAFYTCVCVYAITDEVWWKCGWACVLQLIFIPPFRLPQLLCIIN